MRLRILGRSNAMRNEGRKSMGSNENKTRKLGEPGRLKSLRKTKNTLDPDLSLWEHLRPVFFLLQLVGLAPYNFCKTNRSVQMRPSNIKCIYSFFCILITMYLFKFVYTDFEKFNSTSHLAFRMMIIVEMFFSFFVYWTDMVIEFVQRDKFVHLVNTIATFDKRNDELWEPYPPKLGCRLKMVAILIVVLWLFFGYTNHLIYDFNFLALALPAYIMTALSLFKIYAMLFILNGRFSCLNSTARGIELQSRRRIVAKKLATMHYQLIDACEKLNDIYSWSLFLHIYNLSLNIMGNIYFIMVMILSQNSAYKKFCALCIWECIYIVQLCPLHASLDALSLKATFIPQILLDWQRHDVRPNKQDVLGSSLHFFNRRLIFTAGGCFELNLSLLTSISSNITTYLVIVLQL